MDDSEKTIYRYKLSPDIVELLTNFSRLHMYVSRETFKEKWKEWLITNNEIVEKERKRLKDLGCTKNIDNKMYTASRYYFKKKETKEQDREDNNKSLVIDNKKKREYIILDENLVSKMDIYIKEHYSREFKPSTSYNIFIELNNEEVTNEVERLFKINISKLNSREKCREKIKKTFKNRCFVLQQKSL